MYDWRWWTLGGPMSGETVVPCLWRKAPQVVPSLWRATTAREDEVGRRGKHSWPSHTGPCRLHWALDGASA